MQLQAQSNYHILCECFADRIIQRSAAPSTNTSRRKTKGRKRSLNTGQNVSILEEHKTNEADDLAEFVNVRLCNYLVMAMLNAPGVVYHV